MGILSIRLEGITIGRCLPWRSVRKCVCMHDLSQMPGMSPSDEKTTGRRVWNGTHLPVQLHLSRHSTGTSARTL